ncbi:YdeI/OmpD-associated family protein [Hymenobacter sp. HSC-4F20]|uniref:YdeI/OmpD-associated family protein n=1 Tax=Hymenobacter sp. HSC-4F20 TaxID=2864135 RepID=UPI001C736EC4|nr:YdeI/OmpD-associated family protein [Hymenobacter sp. HSC-4F20]MBX0292950.1 YdeI/OmpD-associated family protein [Hymenobacter sp. HSC-4F20]
MATKLDSLEVVDAPSRPEWRAWLAAHHTHSVGIWLVLYKKGSGPPRLSYAEAVEEALCFGWIDSLPRKVDASRFHLYFSPRRKGSVWSAVNKKRIEQLRAAGLLMPAGQVKIAAAQQDGSWTALDEVDALRVPPDLAAALAATPGAEQSFSHLAPSSRKQHLQQLAAARRPETRQRRIARIVEQLTPPQSGQ